MNYPIYLDYNATTPCDPRVLEAMLPYFTQHFGNAASRSHAFGWVAEEAVDAAREGVAALIGAEKGEIIFTSGATESVNLALRGTFETYRTKRRHIITCSVEHKAVLDTCHHLESIGASVTVLPVGKEGRVDPADVEAAIRPDTLLISIMYANNETGVIMPVKEIGAIARKHNVFFCCDATQAVGKIPVNVTEDGIDLLCSSAHKVYGPKGSGALYVRRRDPRVRLSPMQFGGGHEKGMRSGTLNVPGIVGLGKACEIASHEMKGEGERLSVLRDRLLDALLAIPGTSLNGDRDHLLPQTCNVSFAHTENRILMGKINRDLALSTGSACMSATPEPSYVLRAMGMGDERAAGSLRFSLGRMTTETEITRAVALMQKVLTQ